MVGAPRCKAATDGVLDVVAVHELRPLQLESVEDVALRKAAEHLGAKVRVDHIVDAATESFATPRRFRHRPPIRRTGKRGCRRRICPVEHEADQGQRDERELRHGDRRDHTRTPSAPCRYARARCFELKCEALNHLLRHDDNRRAAPRHLGNHREIVARGYLQGYSYLLTIYNVIVVACSHHLCGHRSLNVCHMCHVALVGGRREVRACG